MQKVPLEIVIPIYNEGEKVIKLLNQFEKQVNVKIRVLLCYDLDNDNVFNYENQLKKCSFEVILVKNPLAGPCEAIKHGLNFGNSECVIVFPADDFLNINIIDQMYSAFKNNNDIVVASRFIKGGSMKDCPLIKSVLVRFASFTLYFFQVYQLEMQVMGLGYFQENF